MKTTEQQNAMIAEFMGGKLKTQALPIMGSRMHHYDIWLPIHGICIIKQLKYHTSWDWLIPVVEKIESTSADEQNYKFQVAIQNKHCTLSQSNLFANKIVYGATKLEATYNAVCQFIECYNANN